MMQGREDSDPGAHTRVPTVGHVARQGDGWMIMDVDGRPMPVVASFMLELEACGSTRPTERSYCYDLLRWFRFLAAVDVTWQTATRTQVRDFVLWMRGSENPQRRRSSVDGRPAPGSINDRTFKQYLAAGYAPRTVNHALSVLSAFYDFAVRAGRGPLINPVPPARRAAQWRGTPARRADYRQRVPRTQPRDISLELLEEIFVVLANDRDRAMVALALSSGVRASELLSMTVAGVDAGRGVFAVVPKGGAETMVWVPAAPEAFVWVARYLSTRPTPDDRQAPMWLTLRSPACPLNYFALRQVLERANTKLGTNLSWHDFRHTFVHRLFDDDRMSLPQIQLLSRHRSLSALAAYGNIRLPELIRQFHQHLSTPPPTEPVGVSYDAADLAMLFPGHNS